VQEPPSAGGRQPARRRPCPPGPRRVPSRANDGSTAPTRARACQARPRNDPGEGDPLLRLVGTDDGSSEPQEAGRKPRQPARHAEHTDPGQRPDRRLGRAVGGVRPARGPPGGLQEDQLYGPPTGPRRTTRSEGRTAPSGTERPTTGRTTGGPQGRGPGTKDFGGSALPIKSGNPPPPAGYPRWGTRPNLLDRNATQACAGQIPTIDRRADRLDRNPRTSRRPRNLPDGRPGCGAGGRQRSRRRRDHRHTWRRREARR
jgi:hypothetical protein